MEYHPQIVIASEALQAVMKGANVNNQAAREMGEVDREARAPKAFADGSDTFMSRFRDATFKRSTRPLVVHKVGSAVSFFFLSKLCGYGDGQ